MVNNSSLGEQKNYEHEMIEIRSEILLLKEKDLITEQDLDHLSRKIEEKKLSRTELISLLEMIGKVLTSRPETWLNELGGSASMAARLRIDPQLDHSLPDNVTRFYIINILRGDFEHSLFIESDENNQEEDTMIPSAGSGKNDLELSGVFQEAEETPNDARTETATPSTSVPEEIQTLPEFQDEGPWEDDPRIRTAFKKKFLEMIQEEALDFKNLSRGNFFDSLDQLQRQLNTFLQQSFRTLRNYSSANETYVEHFMNSNPHLISQLLQKKQQLMKLRERYEQVSQVGPRRRQQMAAIDEIREEVNEVEEAYQQTDSVHQYLKLLRHTLISHIRDVTEEQRILPDEVRRIKAEVTQLSEELYALEATFPEPWGK